MSASQVSPAITKRTDPRPATSAFAAATTLFFAWGFITAMIDPLIPAMRAAFSLSYAESMLTQFAFFMAYGIVSLPASVLLARRGYSASILAGLAAMFGGCVLMIVANDMQQYSLVLCALFVIATGITVLQVAANPLAASLGPVHRSHLRLTLSQAFNSLGTVLAPYIGAMIMLRGGLFAAGSASTVASRATSLGKVNQSFGIIALLIVLLGVFIVLVRRRIDASASVAVSRGSSPMAALRSRWAAFGALAIFLYVGAEVSIGSIMINFLHQPATLGVTLEQAGKILSLYWLGAMVGRFGGTVLLTRVAAGRLTSLAALAAATLCASACLLHGPVAAYAALAIGLFNSIMFPTIFTMTLNRSSASEAATSGLLCMAIVGGAVLPPIVGRIADQAGLSVAFIVPFLAYLVIASFAAAAQSVEAVGANQPAFKAGL